MCALGAGRGRRGFVFGRQEPVACGEGTGWSTCERGGAWRVPEAVSAPVCRVRASAAAGGDRRLWWGAQVSLTADFSACRVYWRSEVPAEQNASTEAVLQRSAAHMR